MVLLRQKRCSTCLSAVSFLKYWWCKRKDRKKHNIMSWSADSRQKCSGIWVGEFVHSEVSRIEFVWREEPAARTWDCEVLIWGREEEPQLYARAMDDFKMFKIYSSREGQRNRTLDSARWLLLENGTASDSDLVELLWRENPEDRTYSGNRYIWGREAAATSSLRLGILRCQKLMAAEKAREAEQRLFRWKISRQTHHMLSSCGNFKTSMSELK